MVAPIRARFNLHSPDGHVCGGSANPISVYDLSSSKVRTGGGGRHGQGGGEAHGAARQVTFDPQQRLVLYGSRVTSDAGLLAFRDLDHALGLRDLAGAGLADTRMSQNSHHTLIVRCAE